MMTTLLLTCFVAMGAEIPADRVTLIDGIVIPGVITQISPRGGPTLVIERAWARANASKWLEAWERAEKPAVTAARKLRRRRLEAWADERKADGAGGVVSAWIEAQKGVSDDSMAESPLLTARILRGDVRSIERAPRASVRLLKLGWISEIPEASSLGTDELKQALEGRGVSADRPGEPDLSNLLPPHSESDLEWLAHRAATEVTHDPGLRYIRHGDFLLAEPAPGEMPSPLEGLSTLGDTLKSLIEDTKPADPLPARLLEAEKRGKAGVLVTRLDMAPDFSNVQVQTTLWGKVGAQNWHPLVTRQGTARPGAQGAGDGADLLADPQVKAIFGAVESLNLGAISDDLKRTSLGMGAATRQALGAARSEMQSELDRLALPVNERPAAAAPDPAAGAGPAAPSEGRATP